MHARPVVGNVALYRNTMQTRKMNEHDFIFTNSYFCRLHRDNNGIIYKNLLFEIRFQKLQHIIVVLLSGFCWKQCNLNAT